MGGGFRNGHGGRDDHDGRVRFHRDGCGHHLAKAEGRKGRRGAVRADHDQVAVSESLFPVEVRVRRYQPEVVELPFPVEVRVRRYQPEVVESPFLVAVRVRRYQSEVVELPFPGEVRVRRYQPEVVESLFPDEVRVRRYQPEVVESPFLVAVRVRRYQPEVVELPFPGVVRVHRCRGADVSPYRSMVEAWGPWSVHVKELAGAESVARLPFPAASSRQDVEWDDWRRARD